MNPPKLPTAAVALVERSILAALSLDPTASAKLAALGERAFHLQLTSPELDIYLLTHGDTLSLQQNYAGDVTVSLKGSLSEFIQVAQAEDSASALINGAVELHGDSAPLLELQRLIGQLDLDWEAPLVRLLGDVAGHQLAEAIRRSHRWGSDSRSALRYQLEDFLKEESDLLVAEWHIEQFSRDINQLRSDTDRLQARLRRARVTLAQANPTSQS